VKLNIAGKHITLNKDAWIVLGGVAAAVTAVVAVSSRGGSHAGSGAYVDPYAQLPAGSTPPPEDPVHGPYIDPITTAPSPVSPPATDYPSYAPPPVVKRAAPAPVSAPAYYHDAKGNEATLAQIYAQQFPTASPTVYQTPAPVHSVAAPVVASSIPDALRSWWGNPNAPIIAAELRSPSGLAYAASAQPIIASSLKAPGGGLAYPAGDTYYDTATYIGGGGQDLFQRRGEYNTSPAPAASGGGDAMLAA
jgi:hypothetical protein